MNRASVKPAAWNLASVSSAICITGSGGYPGKAMEGMATSLSSSLIRSGMRAAALSATSWVCISCSDSVSMPRGGVSGEGSEEDAADERADRDRDHRHDEHRDEEAVVEQLGAQPGGARQVEVRRRDLGAVGRQRVDAAEGAGPHACHDAGREPGCETDGHDGPG